jgi:hypothetical protein
MCRTYNMLLKVLSFISTGFAKQIKPTLHILCYNGILVTWTAVSLTTANFKPLILTRLYSLGADLIEITASSIVACLFVAAETCLLHRCLSVAASSVIPAFSHDVTIHWLKIFHYVAKMVPVRAVNTALMWQYSKTHGVVVRSPTSSPESPCLESWLRHELFCVISFFSLLN